MTKKSPPFSHLDFKIKKTTQNSTHNFYKKCDTNITLKIVKKENLYNYESNWYC